MFSKFQFVFDEIKTIIDYRMNKSFLSQKIKKLEVGTNQLKKICVRESEHKSNLSYNTRSQTHHCLRPNRF